MRLSDFDYQLPVELIADYPSRERSHSRLLHVLEPNNFSELFFYDLPSLLNPNDLLIFNDTKVIPARFFAEKSSGGKVEILIERVLENNHALVQIGANRSPKIGSTIYATANHTFQIIAKKDHYFLIEAQSPKDFLSILHEIGEIPLPPYIKRHLDETDNARYQTIYAKNPGAVAAPTAGLHFDEPLKAELDAKGITQAFVTLHVGAGTFKPVKHEEISAHRMHSEWFAMPDDTVKKINQAKTQGGRIIAVGTTTLRVLESIAKNNKEITACQGQTDLFITPGFNFRCVDALITNFHLPKSTLLILVSAFAGMDTIRNAYAFAIKQRYRFYSYGDAMLLTRRQQ